MSSNQSNSSSSGGITFFGLLGIVFIVLKLCGVIDWSWIWVLSPLWIPSIIAIVAIIVYAFFLAWVTESRRRERK